MDSREKSLTKIVILGAFYSNNSLSFRYCLQFSIDSREKSLRLCEFGSFVQLIKEKSDSTLLVPGMMLAMAPQNNCRW